MIAIAVIALIPLYPASIDSQEANGVDSDLTESEPVCGDLVSVSFRAASIPQRPNSAMTGSQFASMTRGWTGRKRQEAALAELRKGNIPSLSRVGLK